MVEDLRPRDAAVVRPLDVSRPGREAGLRPGAQEIVGVAGQGRPCGRSFFPPSAVARNASTRQKDVAGALGRERERDQRRRAALVAGGEGQARERLAAVVGASERAAAADDDVGGRPAGQLDAGKVEREAGDDSPPGRTAVGALQKGSEVTGGVAGRPGAVSSRSAFGPRRGLPEYQPDCGVVDSGRGGRENHQRRDRGTARNGERAHRLPFCSGEGQRRSCPLANSNKIFLKIGGIRTRS